MYFPSGVNSEPSSRPSALVRRISLPPFDDITFQEKDHLIFAATRDALTTLLKTYPNIFQIEEDSKTNDSTHEVFSAKDQMLAEAMIVPTSRMIGLSLGEIGFHRFR